MQYLRGSIGDANRNKTKLFQAIQYLASKLNDNNNISEIVQTGGIDLVFDLIGDTLQMDNVNLQKGLCTHLIVVCSNPASKQHPAQKNGFSHISRQIAKYLQDKDFCIYACNAVCNVCHDNPVHRNFAIASDIVDAIVSAMDAHRGKAEGDKVHQTACMALRNIGYSTEGQAAVGAKGLKAITDGVDYYFETPNMIKSSMAVMCNLCVLPENGKAFIESDCLKLWTRIYDASQPGSPVRGGVSTMIHNLASKQLAAIPLATNDDGLHLIIGKLLRESPHDSALFANTLKGLAALMYTLPPNKQLKITCMNKMIEQGVLDVFNRTLADSKNPALEELVATVTVSIVQTSIPLGQKVADGETPKYLVGCLNNPSPQTLHCCMAIWFHITDVYGNQKQLIEAGVLKFLCQPWYQAPVKDDTLRIAMSLILKLIANTKNYDQFRPHVEQYKQMADFLEHRNEDIKKQVKSLREDLESVKKGGYNKF